MEPSVSTPTEEWSDEIPAASAKPSVAGSSSRRRRRRFFFGLLGVVVAAFAVLAVSTLWLVIYPTTNEPAHADGILSLNGSQEESRSALAMSLAEKGYAPVLLFSKGGDAADTSCPKVPRVSVVCFVDTSNNTRVKPEWAGRYATRHHWHSIVIVPGRTQATRPAC